MNGQIVPRRIWFTHALLPSLALIAALALAGWGELDLQLARQWFFDSTTQRWLGADTWWADTLIHTRGRDAIRAIAALALLTLLLGQKLPRWRRWRRPAGYLLASLLASTLFVGALKQVTNVDCPWDLQGFGGTRPIIHLFQDRPDDLPHAACFPGAHSSSGFALLCLYFLLRHRGRAAASAGLAIGVLVGGLFAFGQEARGAHFLSHDLSSALLVWLICLSLYIWAFRGNVAPDPA